MTLIKRTLINMIVNVLIILSLFIFVNCFGKQETWPLVVSGIVFVAFLAIKIAQVSKDGRQSQHRYHRAR